MIKKILVNVGIFVFVFMLSLNFSFSKDLVSKEESTFYQGVEIRLKAWASKLSGSNSFDPNATYGIIKGTSFTSPTSFDLQNVYGFGGTKTSLQLELKKEINEKSFGYISYFTDSRKSQVTLTSPAAFVWNQNTQGNPAGITFLQPGDNLSTSMKVSAFDIGYGYYIGKKYERGYVAALIGIRFNNVSVDWTYSGSISGSDLYRKRGASGFIGVEGKYNFSDNLVGFLRVDGGVIGGAGNRVGQFEYELGANLKLTNTLHLELGYKYADIRAREDIGSKINLKLQGINGGLVFKF